MTTSVDVTSTPTSESEEPSGTSDETLVPGKVTNVRIENDVLIWNATMDTSKYKVMIGKNFTTTVGLNIFNLRTLDLQLLGYYEANEVFVQAQNDNHDGPLSDPLIFILDKDGYGNFRIVN